ncbi:tryptophan-rich sensory protein [Maribacter sp. PR1]|uniref:Tryptophan-rich sensory protein n=1 Tax=Maribacter cobaltidurans TaxID=1178778 RepID=A0ABU7IPV4_9FLAO|nr:MULTISPECIES: tryptophan-rich sensory protein [Maribacter]MDC6387601.1 tryptophan-rich sensory protein [Maribacter sp. PR1]MEE1974989.1 tryptophan-rich sensory protein [Maribacter cobaltidurans]
MTKKGFSLLNLISVIGVIAVNYSAQIFSFNNTTIGEVSQRYDNLFTPASYAFAIWGLIFLGLLAFSIFQVRRAFYSDKESPFIEQTGFWFALANILNGCWVFAFLYDSVGFSVLIMFGILLSLIKVILNTNMERWDAPIATIAFIWWPICLYSGWITVATVANVSAYLSKVNWEGGPFSEITWTLIMIAIAVLINLLMIWKRNMREFSAVGIWALVAIFVRHQDTYSTIAYTAMAGALILTIVSMIHGYKNRHTNPVYKLKQRLQKT